MTNELSPQEQRFRLIGEEIAQETQRIHPDRIKILRKFCNDRGDPPEGIFAVFLEIDNQHFYWENGASRKSLKDNYEQSTRCVRMLEKLLGVESENRRRGDLDMTWDEWNNR